MAKRSKTDRLIKRAARMKSEALDRAQYDAMVDVLGPFAAQAIRAHVHGDAETAAEWKAKMETREIREKLLTTMLEKFEAVTKKFGP
jgi:hypothetical protein